jgi:hypothetical protein
LPPQDRFLALDRFKFAASFAADYQNRPVIILLSCLQ